MELVGNGLHIGLGQDEFTDALPMVAAFSLRRQRQQVITHVLHCAQNLAVLRRQRVGQLLLQVWLALSSVLGFCVLRAKARGHRDLITVVGHAVSWRTPD